MSIPEPESIKFFDAKPLIQQLQSLCTAYKVPTSDISELITLKSLIDRLNNKIRDSLPKRGSRKQKHKPKLKKSVPVPTQTTSNPLNYHPPEANKNSRKNNIVIHGLLRDSENTELNITSKVSEFIKEKLKSAITPATYILLGKPAVNTPVLVKLKNYSDKLTIFKKCVNLKPFGSNYSIVNDMTKSERLKRAAWSSRLLE